jgi:hypothetical protein
MVLHSFKIEGLWLKNSKPTQTSLFSSFQQGLVVSELISSLLTQLFFMITTGILQWTHRQQIELIELVKQKKLMFTDWLLRAQLKREFLLEPGKRKMSSQQFTEQILKLILSVREMLSI